MEGSKEGWIGWVGWIGYKVQTQAHWIGGQYIEVQ
jgi:hypothetical protein